MKLLHYYVAALLLSGCASESLTTGPQQLTREFVDRNLMRGKTTKAQVKALLGDPISMAESTMNPNGFSEIWTYKKMFYRDPVEKGFGYAVAYGMVNPYSSYDRVEVSLLLVQFDANGVVRGHTFSTAAAGMPR